MAAKRRRVHGLFTALMTPFTPGGAVSHDVLARLVRLQLRAGVDGLYVCGTTGLGPLLSPEERKAVAETVLHEVAGRATVVVQVGCADTPSTVKLARHAEDRGADAVASLTPYYYKPGDLAVQRHFEAVAAAVEAPLFAYNIPQFTGNNLSSEAIGGMAKRGTLAGVKDSSRDVLHLLDVIEAVPDGFVVMNGTEEYALYSLMMGGDGLVSGGANAFPELMVALVRAFGRGDTAAAVEAQRNVLKFRAAVSASPIPSYYEVLRERHVDCGTPRQPFLPMAGGSMARLVAELEASPLG